MENWQADRATPREFSAARLDGCKLCILLVAFRCGSTPDATGRSITQIEYDAAKKRGIDILPFLLAEQTPVGDDGWNPKYDERATDPNVGRWRETLRQTHGVGEFGADPKSLRIEAALARWVVQNESDRAKRFRRAVTRVIGGLFLCVAAALSYVWYAYKTPELRSQYHSRYLAFHDPNVFNSSRDGLYSVARVLADTKSLVQDTNLTAEIGATRFSFDMLVSNAGTIRHAQKDNFENLIKRGGRLRIILWDYSSDNKAYDLFDLSVSQAPGSRDGAKYIRKELEDLRRRVLADPAAYKGSFDFRWNSRLLFYTMWIRDWDQRNRQNALGHLNVHFYQGQPYWPSFRVSALDGSDLLDNMHREFEYAWERSKRDIPPD